MILTVANISSQLATGGFQAAVAAIARQVTEDFQPEWSIPAHLRSTAFKLGRHKAPIQGHHDAIIYVGDAAEDPTTGVEGALGCHFANHEGVPYGFVYLDICEQLEESWTSTLSHEVLELLVDPTAVLTVSAPAPHQKHSVYYDLEVCDPTQGDSYEIDSVMVSNFVGRRYFGLPGGSGRTNYLNLHLEPFGVRPNGYLQYEDHRGTHQVNGKSVTERQLAAKKRLRHARRNERRAQRSFMAREKSAGQE